MEREVESDWVPGAVALLGEVRIEPFRVAVDVDPVEAALQGATAREELEPAVADCEGVIDPLRVSPATDPR